MKMIKKKIIALRSTPLIALAILLMLTVTITLLPTTSATTYQLVCLSKGQTIKYSECNPVLPDYTCKNTFCQVCTSICSNGAYGPASLNSCNYQGSSCATLDSNNSVDQDPPNLTIINPVQDFVYNSRAIPLVLDTDEESDLSYLDNIYGRGRWKRLCGDCTSYNNKRSFKEGFNDITFRAEDFQGNTIEINKTFFIDSKEPKISRTEPRRGFASGFFEVQFQEENPVLLMLHYGNDITGFREKTLDINDCTLNRNKYTCETQVPLEDYDGQLINYWFHLMDIANSEVLSKSLELEVDTTFPVLNSLNYTQDDRRIELLLDITELNFDEATYTDNFESNPRARTLCSRLKDNICKKRLTLRPGIHDIDIQIMDEAGNSIGTNLQVIV